MNEVWLGLLTAVLGGGIFQAIAAMLRSRAERKKLDAETESVEARTEPEIESLSVATMVNALQGARSINDDLNKQVTRLGERLEEVEAERLRDSKRTHEEFNTLRRELHAAREYITIILARWKIVLPHEDPPEPPQNYRNL